MSVEKFGRYEIKRILGQGGMAMVYLAYDPTIKREVAVKVLSSHLTHDPQFRGRFEREVRMVANLEHPCIVPVYDYGAENDQPYIVMRYMLGGSLLSRIKHKPLTPAELSAIMDRVARALDKAHYHNIIHRDIKPGNILFDDQGQAYLSDFGLSKVIEDAATRTGSAMIGTPAYMSPEQGGGGAKKPDGRSDIYGLGVIIFEGLTGQLPYQADTPVAMMMKHITQEIPNIHQFRPDLPADYQIVLQQAMAKTPEQRYIKASDLAEDLTAIANGKKIQPRAELRGGATEPVPELPPQAAVSHPQPSPPNAAAQPVEVSKARRGLSSGVLIGVLALLGLGLLTVGIAGIITLFRSTGSFSFVPTFITKNNPPLATPVPTPTSIPIAQPAATFTPTPTPTPTFTPTPTPTPTSTPPPIPTPTPLQPTPAPTTEFGLVVDNFEDLGSNAALNALYQLNTAWGANKGNLRLVGPPHTFEGEQAMAFEFEILGTEPDDYSGFERKLFPQDWTAYSLLCFWIKSDGSGYDLVTQFGEANSEVWKHVVALSTLDEEEVCFSLNQDHFVRADFPVQHNNQIDLEAIDYYGFFVEGPAQGPGIIYIDNMRVINKIDPPTPTPAATPTSTPVVVCTTEPQGEFYNLWARHKSQLGCPRQIKPVSGFYAEQPFENGHMFWSKAGNFYLITIGQDSGTWQLVPESESTWQEGMPEKSCDIPTPVGYIHPIRGFGGLWCARDDIREQIGWGLSKERGIEDGTDMIQEFEWGFIFRDSDGHSRSLAYVMVLDEGTFIKEPY